MSDGKFVYCGDVKMLHRSFGAKSVCFHLDMKEAQRLRDGLDEAISLRRRYERQQKNLNMQNRVIKRILMSIRLTLLF